SALRSQAGRGIYPAGTLALQIRAGKLKGLCLTTFLRTKVRASLPTGARDLSRRNAGTAEPRGEISRPCGNQPSCALKSALRSQPGRGIYPAGTPALQIRAGKSEGRVLTNLPAD